MAADRKYCRRCGTENSKDAKFCRKCGTAFAMPAQGEPPKPVKKEEYLCEYCGQPIEPGAVTCRHCGADVPENVRVKRMTAAAAVEKKPAAEPVKKQAPAKPAAPAAPTVNTTQRSAGKQKTPQAKKAGNAKKPAGKQKKGGRRLAMILAVALLLETAFGYPGFMKKHGTPSVPVIGEELASYVDNAVPIGKSEAVRLDVEKGVVVTAAENALYEDTTLKVEPVESASEELVQLEEEMRETGEYAFAAWEVDAGLEPDECLPGEFKMDVDLAEFNVPENLYDSVCFYRYADDGSLLEYSTERDGSVITFTSNQNSLIIPTVVTNSVKLAVLGYAYTGFFCVTDYFEKGKAEEYYTTKPGEKPFTLKGSSAGCDYKLMFFASDVDPEFGKKTDRLREIQKAAISAVEEDMRKDPAAVSVVDEDMKKDPESFHKHFAYNMKKASLIDQMLSNNAEYKNILQSIAAPKYFKRFGPIVDEAYQYLDSIAMVKMPKYCVDIYLKTGLDDLAYQVTKFVGDPHIDVNVTPELVRTAETGGEIWDNLLLTMTHELFHVCQANYNLKHVAESITFDEMAAALLESDAFEYYKKSGKITTEPERLLKEPAYLEMLYYPMEHDFTDGEKKTNQTNRQQHGYSLAHFADYLRKKLDSSVTAKDLMESRSYALKTNISDPLKYCFKLSDDALDSYYKSFVMDHNSRYDNKKVIAAAFNGGTKIPRRTVYIKDEKAKKIETEFDGPLCVKYHSFLVSAKVPVAFLLVPDENFEEACPGAVIVPSQGYQRTSKGIFVTSEEGVSKDPRIILECMGTEYRKNSNSSYTVYPIRQPAAPDISVEDNKLYLNLPEADDVYKDGHAAGCRAVFSVNGEERMTRLIKADEFGTTVSVSLAELTGEDEEDAEISVYYIPVLYDSEDSPVGPKSPTSTVNAQQESAFPTIEIFGRQYIAPKDGYDKKEGFRQSEVFVFTLTDEEMRVEEEYIEAFKKLPGVSFKEYLDRGVEHNGFWAHSYYFNGLDGRISIHFYHLPSGTSRVELDAYKGEWRE